MTKTIEISCRSGKITYKTRAKAKKGLLHRKNAAQGASVQPYQCWNCGYWHLTSTRS